MSTKWDKLPAHKKYGWQGGYEVECEKKGCKEIATERYLHSMIWYYYCKAHGEMLP